MKKRHYVAVAALVASAMVGCSGTKEVKSTTGLNLANLDTTVSAGTDFYRYACGGWMKNNPLTDEYSRYGTFEVLIENNRKQLQDLIEGLAAKENPAGSLSQKIGDLYNMAMDSVTRNQQGVEPIKAELDKIAGLTDKRQFF